jgi:hypothetical protein
MRGKVLEALAMGRPVVTTSLGAEGLGATAGQHLLVADDAPRFAAAVRRALDDQELARALGAAGRRLVETCFDWNAIAAAHDQIYEAALAVPPAPPPPPLERAALLHRTLGRAGWAPDSPKPLDAANRPLFHVRPERSLILVRSAACHWHAHGLRSA